MHIFVSAVWVSVCRVSRRIVKKTRLKQSELTIINMFVCSEVYCVLFYQILFSDDDRNISSMCI